MNGTARKSTKYILSNIMKPESATNFTEAHWFSEFCLHLTSIKLSTHYTGRSFTTQGTKSLKDKQMRNSDKY
ncbi:hypothetical protein KSF78_0003352 [Schistosoma japonicum]|nr:hypothetical protein KSF78_0003352 [Schistosoma japonicum]